MLSSTNETTELVKCELCEIGFERVAGVHIGSQRLGMIPNTPCQRVLAENTPEKNVSATIRLNVV